MKLVADKEVAMVEETKKRKRPVAVAEGEEA